MTKYNYSAIFTLANFLFKTGVFTNISESLKCAWLQAKNENNLYAGPTSFSFRKANGEIREAFGTLNGGFFNYEYKGAEKVHQPLVQRYFDFDRGGWRSYRIDRLVAINLPTPIEVNMAGLETMAAA